jgi:hypothetical protein
VRQWRGQLAGEVASHEAPFLACLLEHPSWRLVFLAEATVVSGQCSRDGAVKKHGREIIFS